MAYDIILEERIDEMVHEWGLDVDKKRMFGGLAYMLHGNMAFGIMGEELLIRASAADGDNLLKQRGVRHFHMGRQVSSRGWYLVDGDEVASDKQLSSFLQQSRDHVLTLPQRNKH